MSLSARFLALAAPIFAACTAYEASFVDCTVHCGPNGACPEGLACGSENLCRDGSSPTACSDLVLPSTPPSCAGAVPSCGPAGLDDCCSTATPIPGGTFLRSYDVASDGAHADPSFPATVSAFRLDKYEVTVERFRRFVEAGEGTRQHPPAAEAGAHARITGSGWDPSWNGNLEADTSTLRSALRCDAGYATWTTSPGVNESLPINCVTWYEAAAFCAWDGGYLPTETEWNFAAASGNEQRVYPWSSPAGSLAVDCSRANYDPGGLPTTYCTPGTGGSVATMNRVGSESPMGDGAWGHADLAGNAWEWTLDWGAPYMLSCDDCSQLQPSDHRVIRGGNFSHDEQFMRAAHRGFTVAPTSRTRDVGFRCGRPMIP